MNPLDLVLKYALWIILIAFIIYFMPQIIKFLMAMNKKIHESFSLVKKPQESPKIEDNQDKKEVQKLNGDIKTNSNGI